MERSPEARRNQIRRYGKNHTFELKKGINRISPHIVIEVNPLIPFADTIPGEVALHEAQHAALDLDNVDEISILPTKNSLGHTKFKHRSRRFALAAMGPHSMGAKGTGYDYWLTATLGHDPESVASAARSELVHLDKDVRALARGAQAKGSLTGSEAREIVKKDRNPSLSIHIKNFSTGRERQYVQSMERNYTNYIDLETADLDLAA